MGLRRVCSQPEAAKNKIRGASENGVTPDKTKTSSDRGARQKVRKRQLG